MHYYSCDQQTNFKGIEILHWAGDLNWPLAVWSEMMFVFSVVRVTCKLTSCCSCHCRADVCQSQCSWCEKIFCDQCLCQCTACSLPFCRLCSIAKYVLWQLFLLLHIGHKVLQYTLFNSQVCLLLVIIEFGFLGIHLQYPI